MTSKHVEKPKNRISGIIIIAICIVAIALAYGAYSTHQRNNQIDKVTNCIANNISTNTDLPCPEPPN